MKHILNFISFVEQLMSFCEAKLRKFEGGSLRITNSQFEDYFNFVHHKVLKCYSFWIIRKSELISQWIGKGWVSTNEYRICSSFTNLNQCGCKWDICSGPLSEMRLLLPSYYAFLLLLFFPNPHLPTCEQRSYSTISTPFHLYLRSPNVFQSLLYIVNPSLTPYFFLFGWVSIGCSMSSYVSNHSNHKTNPVPLYLNYLLNHVPHFSLLPSILIYNFVT